MTTSSLYTHHQHHSIGAALSPQCLLTVVPGHQLRLSMLKYSLCHSHPCFLTASHVSCTRLALLWNESVSSTLNTRIEYPQPSVNTFFSELTLSSPVCGSADLKTLILQQFFKLHPGTDRPDILDAACGMPF